MPVEQPLRGPTIRSQAEQTLRPIGSRWRPAVFEAGNELRLRAAYDPRLLSDSPDESEQLLPTEWLRRGVLPTTASSGSPACPGKRAASFGLTFEFLEDRKLLRR